MSKPFQGKKGRSGRKSAKGELQISALKTMCVDWAMKQMVGSDEVLKKEITLKVLSRAIPQETIVQGDDKRPLTVKLINYYAE